MLRLLRRHATRDATLLFSLFVDDTEPASPEQAEALVAVASGQRGGAPAGFNPFVGEMLGMELADMAFIEDGRLRLSFSVPLVVGTCAALAYMAFYLSPYFQVPLGYLRAIRPLHVVVSVAILVLAGAGLRYRRQARVIPGRAQERQVRIAAGSLVLLGIGLGWFVHPYLYGLSAFVGGGLVFAGITDTCGMGMLLARMPWNQCSRSDDSCRKS
jgi:hypothetical protein